MRMAGRRVTSALEADADAAFARHGRWLGRRVAERLTELARDTLRVDAQESLKLSAGAVAVARRRGDTLRLAFALRANANALWFLNRNLAAVELYAEAVAMFEILGDRTEVGRTLSSSLQPLIRLGEYGAATESANRARTIFAESGDALRLARLELNAANILHRQDRFAEAYAAYERAYRELLPFRDAEGIAAALHNMAVCLIVLNDYRRALAVYEEAREFASAHGMPALAAQADYNIAYLYFFRGDYSKALQLLREAREAAERAGDQYHRALCFMDQSEIYIELNMHEEAADTAQEAFTGFEALGMEYEAGKSLTNLAIASGRRGEVGRALDLFSRARELFVREGNQVWPALVDLYKGVILHDAGKGQDARRLCLRALRFFRSRKIVSREIFCRLLLARIALAHDPYAAEAHCAAALRLLNKLDASHLRRQAYLLLGQVAERQGNPDAARGHYAAALQEAEQLRSLLRGDELKIAFTADTQGIYAGLVRLALTPEEAFSYMEQAKSRSLRDLVAGSGAPRDLSGKYVDLQQELNWYYHRLEAEQSGPAFPSHERISELNQRARALERELAALLRDAPADDAESAPALPLDAIRRALPPGATLLEYFQTGERFVAAVVTDKSLDVVPLCDAKLIEQAANLLRFQLSKFQLGAEYVAACYPILLDATCAHLGELYRELIGPLEQLLVGDTLVIVPHGQLHHLPMHALFDGERYLIDRFAITYSPSAAVYATSQPHAAETAPGALVVGVPDEKAPMIEDEVRAVAAMLPGSELLLGPAATRTALEERTPAGGLIHIATHGRFREDRPMFSSIKLGDGYLTLYDLYRLKLPANLAALSGCSTGRSVVAGGDELLGLVRGMFHAGARSLLLTLWDVHDRSTAGFMTAFYGALRGNPDAGEALRGAMRAVRETHPHPYYWAPFVLIGKP